MIWRVSVNETASSPGVNVLQDFECHLVLEKIKANPFSPFLLQRPQSRVWGLSNLHPGFRVFPSCAFNLVASIMLFVQVSIAIDRHTGLCRQKLAQRTAVSVVVICILAELWMTYSKHQQGIRVLCCYSMRYELCMFHMSAACMHSNTTNCHSLQLTSSLLILILNNLLFAVICLPVFDVYLVFSSLVMTSHSAAVAAVVQNPSTLGLTKRAIVVCFNHH